MFQVFALHFLVHLITYRWHYPLLTEMETETQRETENLPKVMQLIEKGARTQTQGIWLQGLYSLPPCYNCGPLSNFYLKCID